MGWSGGTFTRTNGTFSGPTVWAQDRDAGTKITAANHDTHDQDIADGLNNCLAKDGSNAMTGDLDLGTFDITNAADGAFSGSLGVGIATPVSTLHIESAGGTECRIRNNTTNAGSRAVLRHSTDGNAVLYGINGVTNGAMSLFVEARANGSGNSSVVFHQNTNVTGAVAADFMRGDGTATSDHKITSGTSGTLVDLCKNGGNVKAGGSVGIGVAPATELHVEGAANPTLRIRENAANANSRVDVAHLSDTSASITATNGVTNGAMDLDIDPSANGSGQAATRFFRNVNVSGTVQAEFHRGNNTDTIDHLVKSGTSGLLADLCRNGGNAKVGGLLGVGVSPSTVIHAEATANPTLRIRESAANASSKLDLIHESDTLARLLGANGVTNGAMQLEIDASSNGSGNSITRFNRNTTTTGTVQVQFCRGDGATTSDHLFQSGTSGVLADLCRNGGDVRCGGALAVASYTNATRPAASSVDVGAMIYNTDDNAPNFSDGTNWRDAMGSVT